VPEGIFEIQAEQASRNYASDSLPPTLPHELAKIRGSAFGEILLVHVDHLRQFWSEESIADIEDQHKRLVRAYQNEPILQSKLDKCNHNTLFKVGWSSVWTDPGPREISQSLDRSGIVNVFGPVQSKGLRIPWTAQNFLPGPVRSDCWVLGYRMEYRIECEVEMGRE
jgi:hypothetical protein